MNLEGKIIVSVPNYSLIIPAAAIVAAVAHKEYQSLSTEKLAGLMNSSPVLIDVKGIYDQQALEKAGIRLWRL